MGKRKRKIQRKGGKKMVKKVVEIPETKITDLNTDCFIEIFQHLNHYDWLNLKLAHSAFGAAVNYMVRIDNYCFDIFSSKEIESFERFIKNFGKEIRSVNIRSNGYSHQIEALIEKYCLNGNIEECNFSGLLLHKPFFMKNLQFFNSLISLQLIYSIRAVDVDVLLDSVATSRSIKELKLLSDKCEFKKSYNIFHKIASSNLEFCQLNFSSNSDLTREARNLPINYTLKVLNLENSHYDPAVLKYFPNIECVKNFNLNADTLKYPLGPILNLRNLKSFELICRNLNLNDTVISSFLSQLADQNNLEMFKLLQHFNLKNQDRNVDDAVLADTLCKMTKLSSLKLRTIFTFEHHLLIIGKCLNNLQTFSFYCSTLSNIKVLNSLLDFIKVSKNLNVIESAHFRDFSPIHFVPSLVNIRKEQQAKEILRIDGGSNCRRYRLSDEQRKYISFI